MNVNIDTSLAVLDKKTGMLKFVFDAPIHLNSGDSITFVIDPKMLAPGVA